MSAVTSVSAAIAPVSSAASLHPAPSDTFSGLLSSAIQSVEHDSQTAQTATTSFLSGNSDDLHTAAIASQRAELSSSLFLAVRNKVLNAYQEVMKMQM